MGSRNRSSRQHLAYLAARMIAEDGVPDCASARRKLARQLGGAQSRDLPDDREITTAASPRTPSPMRLTRSRSARPSIPSPPRRCSARA